MNTSIRELPLWPSRKRIFILSAEAITGRSAQTRIVHPLSFPEQQWDLHWSQYDSQTFSIAAAQNTDLILLHSSVASILSEDTLQSIFALGIPVIYESGNWSPYSLTSQTEKTKVDNVLRQVHAIVVPSEAMADLYRPIHTTVFILQHYLNFDLFYQQISLANKNSPVTIGILGNPRTPAFSDVGQALKKLLSTYRQRVTLEFTDANLPEGWAQSEQIKIVSLPQNYLDYAMQFKGCHWDIAFVLSDGLSDQSKNMPDEWLECAAAGIPCVSSHALTSQDFVNQGHEHLLVAKDAAGLYEHFSSLLNSSAQRASVAQAAQTLAKKHYAQSHFREKTGHFYRTFLQEVSDFIDIIPAKPIQFDDRIPGILILDPLGDKEDLAHTLTHLNSFIPHSVKVVILTTLEEPRNSYGKHIQYVIASPDNYLSLLNRLKHHPTMNWLYRCKAGYQLTAKEIPSLFLFSDLPAQPFKVIAQKNNHHVHTP